MGRTNAERGVLDRLAARPVVPVLRSTAPTTLDAAVETLLDAGLEVVEITLTTPGALAAIERWARAPGLLVGAGTVLDAGQAAASVAAGARFLVSPGTDEDVVREARALGGPFPDLAYVPTGGIGLGDIGDWLRAGALAVGLGGELLGDALEGGSLRALRDRTRRALAAVAPAAPSGPDAGP